MFEKRLPFIAAIITEVFVAAVTYLYFEEYFYLTVGIVVVSLLLSSTQFNPWALVGSLLTALAIMFYTEQDLASLRIVIILLLGGSVLQLVAALIGGSAGEGQVRSSLGLNVLFAVLGVGFAYFLIFRMCEPRLGPLMTDEAGIGRTWELLLGCYLEYSLEPLEPYWPVFTFMRTGEITPPAEADWPTMLNAIFHSFGRMFILGPAVWASVFAAVSEIRFRVYNVGEFVNRFLAGLFGLNFLGCLALVVILALAVAEMVVVIALDNDPVWREYVSLALMTAFITFAAVAPADRVTRS